MSEIRHRHRILEAIDQLRRRKARPDVNRICSFMFRRFSVSCGETKSDLQKLIDAEIVIKVDYKGNTSYRNAAKWAMLPNYKNKQELDSSNTSSILSSAVAELIVLEPDYLDIGVPALELEKHLLRRDSKRFTKKNLETILKREIDNGTLVKLENGNYFLGEHSNASKQNNSQSGVNLTSPKTINRSPLSARPKTKKIKPNKPVDAPPSSGAVRPVENNGLEERREQQKEKMDENGTSSNSNTTASENVGFRVGGRQKRAKVMFDPSDNNLPKVSRKRPPGRPPLNNMVKHMSSINRTSNNSSSNNNNNNNNTSIKTTTSSASNSSSPVLVSGSPIISPIKTYHSVTSSSSPSSVSANNLPVNPSICCLCHSYGIRVKGVPERLIACADCTNLKAHPSCIESRREGSCRNKHGLWQCLHCKRCAVCNETGKTGKIAVCSSCYEAYHFICHNPHIPLNVTEIDRWKCSNCSNNSSSSNSSASNLTIASSNNNNNTSDCKIDEDVKPPLCSPINVSPSLSVTSSSSGIVVTSTSNITIINNPNNNYCSTVSSTTGTINVISSTISSCNTTGSPSSTCVISTMSSATTTTSTISSTVTCNNSIATSEFDNSEDVKDIKPVITNDVKENIQKNFTLPLSNHNSNRPSTYEKGHLPPMYLQDPYDGYPIDETIPDASPWSPQEVFQYFVKYFDPETAKIFKDQEIDGQSLLLMKRSDVLTGLCLKLGPALKVYSHVKKLQIRRSHPKLLWS
ncbi:uncharacterized protein LOC142333015 [Lycorma delicatula]|uniref:uncharacterized protein LOC142333015 n=1 Tax=Lycorma delicatula TaxID=130591 RepID=UPI003F517A91